jgi:centromeric protein E
LDNCSLDGQQQAATMTTALPRASRPSNGPPTAALPALPVGKTRKSTGGIATPTKSNSLNTPKSSGLRAPSTTFLPPTTPAPTAALPQPRAVSTAVTPNAKAVRKVVSINSFPQPPRKEGRVSSLPPSPLSNGAPSSRRLKTPTTPNYTFGNTPSLLNGTGEGKLIPRAGQRTSDGIISVASAPESRSSSAQDSYSTSATQYDDLTDGPAQKSGSDSKRQSKLDGKGNVIVSVRVRPDAGQSDSHKAEGEWMVDGRKSLIAYKGKEGGDYYYGKPNTPGCIFWIGC